MTAFVICPISRSVTSQVRQTLHAPHYGHPAHREIARGTGPCRECLQTFRVGVEERILFTFNSSSGSAHLPHPGPVFIHAEQCVPAAGDHDGTIMAPLALTPGNEDITLEALFATPSVSFLHLRHAHAGCFIARVERAEP